MLARNDHKGANEPVLRNDAVAHGIEGLLAPIWHHHLGPRGAVLAFLKLPSHFGLCDATTFT